jgi:hypothetical protein
MDLTKCNQDIAVIALYDHGNNVEEAVMAVLEQGNQPDVWNENKSRKTKKPEGKKEKTDKKEDRFNDRTRDTGGKFVRMNSVLRLEFRTAWARSCIYSWTSWRKRTRTSRA